MKNRIFYLIAGLKLIIFLLTGCGSTSSLRLETTPDKATATITVLGTSKKKELGMTPLTQKEIPSEFLGVPISIELSKSGYMSESIIVPDLSGLTVDLRKSLIEIPKATTAATSADGKPSDDAKKEEKKEEEKTVKIQRLNRTVDRIFEAVRKIQVDKKDEALQILAELKKDNPELSAIYEIEGNVYFLSKNLEKALESYNEALKYNPDQISLLQMKLRIEKSLGIERKPAQSKAGAQ